MFSKREVERSDSLVEAVNVSREFLLGEYKHQALLDVSLTVRKGDFCAIAGPSGSGKSTLLNILGCLERPTSGEVRIQGNSTKQMSVSELADFRAKKLGFVFQTFNLIPTLNAQENVEYPLLLLQMSAKERRQRAQEALMKVGLEKFKRNRPNQLSGGQRQRVAIARAIVKMPLLILADEPTANLDHRTASEILALMQSLNRNEKTTFLFSSHDSLVLSRAESVMHLADGKMLLNSEMDYVA